MLNDNTQKEARNKLVDACNRAADAWAKATDIGGLVHKMGSNDSDREVLLKFAKHCFAEGVMQGSIQTAGSLLGAGKGPKR